MPFLMHSITQNIYLYSALGVLYLNVSKCIDHTMTESLQIVFAFNCKHLSKIDIDYLEEKC